MKKLVATLTLVLVPFALAACGGDDDEGTSKDDYIAKADAICARSDAETDKVFEAAFENPQNPQPDEAQAAIQEALPGVKTALQQLRALEKPEDDADRIDAIWTAADEGVATLEEASADPAASLAALSADPFGPSEKLAGAYGMKDCGPAQS